jgi:hypothetical protein
VSSLVNVNIPVLVKLGGADGTSYAVMQPIGRNVLGGIYGAIDNPLKANILRDINMDNLIGIAASLLVDTQGVESANAGKAETFVTTFVPPSLSGPLRVASPVSNVANLPLDLKLDTASAPEVLLISAPAKNEPNQALSLSQAMAAASPESLVSLNTDGSEETTQELSVPLSRTSIARLVGSGVRLPSGVEQLLFLVSK